VLCVGGRTGVLGNYYEERFLTSPGQLAGIGAVIVALVVAAYVIKGRRLPRLSGSAPSPWIVGGTAPVLTSAWWGPAVLVAAGLYEWVGVTIWVLVVTAGVVLISRWSRQAGWAHRGHRNTYRTEWVIVPVYVPATTPAGIVMVIFGVHLAWLLPLISDPVTTARGRPRVTVSLVCTVTVPSVLTVPALYRTLPAEIPDPFLDSSFVALAVATQLDPSGALRLSSTVTSPRLPLTTVPSGVFSTVPKFFVADFTEIWSSPPTTVTVRVVSSSSAAAGVIDPRVSKPVNIPAASRRRGLIPTLPDLRASATWHFVMLARRSRFTHPPDSRLGDTV
jgi:hypothetical protein